MSNHTHICPDCGAEFPGDGALVEIDELGTLGCDCLRQERCESCEPSCTRCWDWDGIYTKATTQNAHGQPRCERCADRENESAQEAMLDSYYGGSSPQSDRERVDVMNRVRR